MWVAELVFGFLFWTLLGTFTAQVWFFPLELRRGRVWWFCLNLCARRYMDITGYELVMAALLSPLLLHMAVVRRVASLPLVHVAAAGALAVACRYQALVPRTFWLAPAAGLCTLATAARWRQTAPWLGASAMLVLLDRLAGYSRPSVWLGAPRPLGAWVLLAATTVAALAATLWPDAEENADSDAPPASGVAAALSVGSLLFLFHAFALQASVLPRWLDLAVMPWSLVVALGFICGLWIPAPRWLVPLAPLPAALAMVHAAPSGVAAWVFAASVAALWVPTVHLASWRTLGAAMVVWLLHFVGTIWTVAYNFVPVGGDVTREQTHTHLYVACALAGLGVLLSATPSSPTPSNKRSPYPRWWLVAGLAVVLLFAPIALNRAQHAAAVPVRAAASAAQQGSQVRAMIWAVHFGYNNHGENSFDSIERVVRENNVNVIGLLESDLARPFNDNWDCNVVQLALFCLFVSLPLPSFAVVDWLAERLGMHSDYGPSTLNNTWGCALLSVFPIVHSERILLPSPLGELACLVDATLNVQGKHVHVLVTHFGNYRDAIDRDLQTKEVAAMLGRAPATQPHVYLGYLTNRPYSDHYNALVQAGWVDTAPDVLNRWCQYIFYRGLSFEKFYRYDTGDISDTEAQIAHFRVK